MTVSVNPSQTGEPLFYLADEHPHPEGYSTSLGFWIYLMSDCLIFAMLTMQQNKVAQTQMWLAITGLFGLAFIGIELTEFAHMIHEGATPQRSAFLSSFFTLVGTHGLHVTFGLIWLVTLMMQVWRYGLIEANRRRLMCLSMFWHFLDVVWIGVFTFVYLLGMLR